MKKVLICLGPIIIFVLTIMILGSSKHNKVTIGTHNWYDSDDYFILCSTEIKESNNSDDIYSYFTPKNRDEFLNEIVSLESFLGKGTCSLIGEPNKPAYFFYYNNGIFCLTEYWNKFSLSVCANQYTDSWETADRLVYPCPGEWAPENDVKMTELNQGLGTFDSVFGTYEESIEKFYGFFDDAIIDFSSDDQKIIIKVYDLRKRKFSENHKIVIDFIEKRVVDVLDPEK